MCSENKISMAIISCGFGQIQDGQGSDLKQLNMAHCPQFAKCAGLEFAIVFINRRSRTVSLEARSLSWAASAAVSHCSFLVELQHNTFHGHP